MNSVKPFQPRQGLKPAVRKISTLDETPSPFPFERDSELTFKAEQQGMGEMLLMLLEALRQFRAQSTTNISVGGSTTVVRQNICNIINNFRAAAYGSTDIRLRSLINSLESSFAEGSTVSLEQTEELINNVGSCLNDFRQYLRRSASVSQITENILKSSEKDARKYISELKKNFEISNSAAQFLSVFAEGADGRLGGKKSVGITERHDISERNFSSDTLVYSLGGNGANIANNTQISYLSEAEKTFSVPADGGNTGNIVNNTQTSHLSKNEKTLVAPANGGNIENSVNNTHISHHGKTEKTFGVPVGSNIESIINNTKISHLGETEKAIFAPANGGNIESSVNNTQISQPGEIEKTFVAPVNGGNIENIVSNAQISHLGETEKAFSVPASVVNTENIVNNTTSRFSENELTFAVPGRGANAVDSVYNTRNFYRGEIEKTLGISDVGYIRELISQRELFFERTAASLFERGADISSAGNTAAREGSERTSAPRGGASGENEYYHSEEHYESNSSVHVVIAERGNADETAGAARDSGTEYSVSIRNGGAFAKVLNIFGGNSYAYEKRSLTGGDISGGDVSPAENNAAFFGGSMASSVHSNMRNEINIPQWNAFFGGISGGVNVFAPISVDKYFASGSASSVFGENTLVYSTALNSEILRDVLQEKFAQNSAAPDGAETIFTRHENNNSETETKSASISDNVTEKNSVTSNTSSDVLREKTAAFSSGKTKNTLEKSTADIIRSAVVKSAFAEFERDVLHLSGSRETASTDSLLISKQNFAGAFSEVINNHDERRAENMRHYLREVFGDNSAERMFDTLTLRDRSSTEYFGNLTEKNEYRYGENVSTGDIRNSYEKSEFIRNKPISENGTFSETNSLSEINILHATNTANTLSENNSFSKTDLLSKSSAVSESHTEQHFENAAEMVYKLADGGAARYSAFRGEYGGVAINRFFGGSKLYESISSTLGGNVYSGGVTYGGAELSTEYARGRAVNSAYARRDNSSYGEENTYLQSAAENTVIWRGGADIRRMLRGADAKNLFLRQAGDNILRATTEKTGESGAGGNVGEVRLFVSGSTAAQDNADLTVFFNGADNNYFAGKAIVFRGGTNYREGGSSVIKEQAETKRLSAETGHSVGSNDVRNYYETLGGYVLRNYRFFDFSDNSRFYGGGAEERRYYEAVDNTDLRNELRVHNGGENSAYFIAMKGNGSRIYSRAAFINLSDRNEKSYFGNTELNYAESRVSENSYAELNTKNIQVQATGGGEVPQDGAMILAVIPRRGAEERSAAGESSTAEVSEKRPAEDTRGSEINAKALQADERELKTAVAETVRELAATDREFIQNVSGSVFTRESTELLCDIVIERLENRLRTESRISGR